MNGDPLSPLDPVECLRVIRSVFADQMLTPGQQKVISIAVLWADQKTRQTWASYQRYADEFSLSSATVRKGLKVANNRYLRLLRRGRAGAACYLVMPASSSQNEELHAEKNFNGDNSVLHSASGSSSRSEEILTPDRALCRTPPTPPAGGDAVKSSPGEKPPDAAGDAAILAEIEAAYREVFGSDMSTRWRRRVSRSLSNGDRPWLVQIDANAIRAGQALAAKAGRTFGLGWVLKHLEQQAARRQQAAKGEQVRAAEAEARRKADAEDCERRKAEQRRAAELLDGLPEHEAEALRLAVIAAAVLPDGKPNEFIQDHFRRADWRKAHDLRMAMVKVISAKLETSNEPVTALHADQSNAQRGQDPAA